MKQLIFSVRFQRMDTLTFFLSYALISKNLKQTSAKTEHILVIQTRFVFTQNAAIPAPARLPTKVMVTPVVLYRLMSVNLGQMSVPLTLFVMIPSKVTDAFVMMDMMETDFLVHLQTSVWMTPVIQTMTVLIPQMATNVLKNLMSKMRFLILFFFQRKTFI